VDDHDAVLSANEAFYRAFESLDVSRMEVLWLRAPHIKCVHPGWGPLVGWGPVMDSWRRIFEGTLEMRFALTQVAVEVVGDLAWVIATENIESREPEGRAAGIVQATNLFQRTDGHWLLVHHHGSPILAPLDVPGSTRIH
jgi:ketosteroid isomerase-like protein